MLFLSHFKDIARNTKYAELVSKLHHVFVFPKKNYKSLRSRQKYVKAYF